MLLQKTYEGILDINDLKIIDNSIKYDINGELLKNAFITFCSFSSPSLMDRMSQANYMRLLKICKICDDELISINTAQAIYVKLCKERNLSYMTYDMFILALDELAEQKFPLSSAVNREVALSLLLNIFVFPNLEETEAKISNKCSKDLPIIKSEQKLDYAKSQDTSNYAIQIYENKHLIKVLKIVYNYYMNKDVKSGDCRNKINYENFLKMMKCFKISPSLCPKATIRLYI